MYQIIRSHPGVTVGKGNQTTTQHGCTHGVAIEKTSYKINVIKKSRALLLDIDNKLYITCSRLCRYIASGPITKQ